jgi:polysaccharide export outer membrane protein
MPTSSKVLLSYFKWHQMKAQENNRPVERHCNIHRTLAYLLACIFGVGIPPLFSQLVPAASRTGHLGTTSAIDGSALTNYVLGPDDQVILFVADLDEISGKPMRVDRRGDLNIPLAGRIHAAGLTVDQLETQIEGGLKKALKDPHVVVNVSDFHSQPVSVLGYVANPGVHQLEGRKSLFEMLSMAGGLRPEAGYSIKITRNLKWGRVPLADATEDPTGQFSIGSVSVKDIMNGANPAENIIIKPEDTITVPKADLIYVIGSVKKPGGYVMGQDQTVSALQILSLAEGLDRTAAGDKARVMRTVPGNPSRTEIPINLKKLMEGKAPDVQLRSDDILFVPNSAAKSVLNRTADAALGIGQLAVYAAR